MISTPSAPAVASPTITLRAVEPTDADFMYEVENDPANRLYSDTIAPISRKIIRDYALSYDADPFSARQLRLIISAPNPVGIVDLYEIDPVHRRAFIGIYILPSCRHSGIASKAIAALEDYCRDALRLRLLAARVESSNTSSVSLFKKCGFNEAARIPAWFILPSGAASSLIIFTKFLINNPK